MSHTVKYAFTYRYISFRVCRGLSSWKDPDKSDGDLCKQVIYMATISGFLVAVDAATGRFCPQFGKEVDYLEYILSGGLTRDRMLSSAVLAH